VATDPRRRRGGAERLAVGLAAAMLASQTIRALLFAVSPLDQATYLGVVALLLVVAAMASGAPAWRAPRVDPAVTLRGE
jgi:ABC-type lipoprotein release transport system permease subunit